MPILRIALLQRRAVDASAGDNLEIGIEACREAAAEGADLALFPEMWLLGYAPCPDDPDGRRAWQALAIDPADPWLETFRAESRRLGMAIVATYLERSAVGLRNTASLIDRHGHEVDRYSKVHTCDFAMEAALIPGDGFSVAALDTRSGPVQVGMMICYDREFPESARALMLGGAEVLLTPNACELNEDRIGQFRARAFENMVAVAMANYPAPRYNGRSCAFDGMAFDPHGTWRDHKVVEAGEDDSIEYADIDLSLLRAYRQRETWGDAYRKPYAYAPLLRGDSGPPFVRENARRDPPRGALPPKRN